jgi:hypothetical protein
MLFVEFSKGFITSTARSVRRHITFLTSRQWPSKIIAITILSIAVSAIEGKIHEHSMTGPTGTNDRHATMIDIASSNGLLRHATRSVMDSTGVPSLAMQFRHMAGGLRSIAGAPSSMLDERSSMLAIRIRMNIRGVITTIPTFGISAASAIEVKCNTVVTTVTRRDISIAVMLATMNAVGTMMAAIVIVIAAILIMMTADIKVANEMADNTTRALNGCSEVRTWMRNRITNATDRIIAAEVGTRASRCGLDTCMVVATNATPFRRTVVTLTSTISDLHVSTEDTHPIRTRGPAWSTTGTTTTITEAAATAPEIMALATSRMTGGIISERTGRIHAPVAEQRPAGPAEIGRLARAISEARDTKTT